MSESSEIALTFCRVFVRLIDPENNFLESSYIHLHVPEGMVENQIRVLSLNPVSLPLSRLARNQGSGISA